MSKCKPVLSFSRNTVRWVRLKLFLNSEEADRGNDGKTTSKSGRALNGISYTTESKELRGVEKAVCNIYSGAPTVS